MIVTGNFKTIFPVVFFVDAGGATSIIILYFMLLKMERVRGRTALMMRISVSPSIMTSY